MLNSVEYIPLAKANAAFITDSSKVFREQREISPRHISDNIEYIPWGGDDMMPYDIMELFEKDETLATCNIFNSEVCYGAGLQYDTMACDLNMKQRIEDFCETNDLPELFFGQSQDFKMFGFAVSVVILSKDRKSIASVARREACYCRFSVADRNGCIPYVYYANWRLPGLTEEDIETIPLLDRRTPLADLRARIAAGSKDSRFAVVSRIPTVDNTYYPIPYYAALFNGKWYNIKQLIGIAKEAKIGNSAPIKYHIEISASYWERLFQAEGITDLEKRKERVVEEKQNIIDFLTTAENSGKVWFSQYYVTPDGRENHDVVIHKIDDSKEGGDWSTDIQEAVNMICFTMRVHSNLVGSVPGKSQSNNSGSDKRELHTIAQAAQKPYRDMLFKPHRLIIAFNGWKGAKPVCPFIQLTTLDQHSDARLNPGS